VLLRLLVALVVAAGVALSLVDVRAQTRPGTEAAPAPPAEPAATIERLLDAVIDMPGGNRLYMAITGLTVDGDVLEGVGVAPDIAVERPLPYAGGADPVLDRAMAHLAARSSK
jgi:hypothetical protein